MSQTLHHAVGYVKCNAAERKLSQIGAKFVGRARCLAFQTAAVAISTQFEVDLVSDHDNYVDRVK